MKSIETKKTFILTLLLSAVLFWIGLGVGDNMSDFRFWINSTWSTVKLEWVFIVVYIGLNKKFPSFSDLWKNHKFITITSILWIISISLSYFTSTYYSWQNPLAAMRYIETVSHFFFFLFLLDFFNQYQPSYRLLFSSIVFSTLIVMGYFIYIHFAFPNLEAEEHVFSMRSDKLLLNTHLHRVGYQVEATIAFATALLFTKKWKFFAVILIGIFFLFLLWLGGRAATLGTFLIFIILFWHFRKQISIQRVSIFAVAFFLLFWLAIYFQWINPEYFTHAIHKTLHPGTVEHFLSGRIRVWNLVLKELNNNWLLGTGPQSYFFYFDRKHEIIHAHNFLLQFLGEWGIIGTTLFTVLFYRAIIFGIQNLTQQEKYLLSYRLASLLLIISLTITGFFSGIYFFQQSESYLAFAFAVLLTQKYPQYLLTQ